MIHNHYCNESFSLNTWPALLWSGIWGPSLTASISETGPGTNPRSMGNTRAEASARILPAAPSETSFGTPFPFVGYSSPFPASFDSGTFAPAANDSESNVWVGIQYKIQFPYMPSVLI